MILTYESTRPSTKSAGGTSIDKVRPCVQTKRKSKTIWRTIWFLFSPNKFAHFSPSISIVIHSPSQFSPSSSWLAIFHFSAADFRIEICLLPFEPACVTTYGVLPIRRISNFKDPARCFAMIWRNNAVACDLLSLCLPFVITNFAISPIHVTADENLSGANRITDSRVTEEKKKSSQLA